MWVPDRSTSQKGFYGVMMNLPLKKKRWKNEDIVDLL
jgi:hypothetical protein